ncbi:hypothetical protein ILT42_20850 [Microvirga sp. BT291]|nr:hypothetical protein [Microvirga pudoricolor]
MRLVQFLDKQGHQKAGIVSEDALQILEGVSSIYELAMKAIEKEITLAEAAEKHRGGEEASYAAVIDEKRLLPPITHPDASRCHVTGTGLTHLGSADTRDKMHKTEVKETDLTDSMKMFRSGLAEGRPGEGKIGAQPEWFYKGNGSFVVAPEQPLISPVFGEDGGEEPELAGLYVIAPDGTPVRLGFALGNEFSDHVTERQNYLLLAHSKLRQSSFGPELRLGEPPADIRGTSRIRRGGEVIWEKSFLTGEANMSHSLANLEHHHFKYREHRIPGDVHVHYFGTATLSFADGIRTEPGDVFEIEAEGFGQPLRNPVETAPGENILVRVKAI